MKITFTTPFTETWLKNTKIKFIENRKYLYGISIALTVINIGSLAFRGMSFGVDFKGGRTYVVRFNQDVKVADVQRTLTDAFGIAPEVKTFGPNNQVKITTIYKVDDMSENVDNEVETRLFAGLQNGGFIGKDVTLEQFTKDYRKSSQKVGPTISDDIKRDAIIAVFLALVGIFLYIFVRFRSWRYGLGGVASLLHDSLMVLGIFSLFYGVLPFSLDVDQAFIAAVLTVIGYSINDTVIVFDRIREYLRIHPKRDLKTNMNDAMNHTLRRTFNTSMTTLVVLVAIFFFGGESIRGFVFALLIGIGVGTYSSFFVATPIAYDTQGGVNKVY